MAPYERERANLRIYETYIDPVSKNQRMPSKLGALQGINTSMQIPSLNQPSPMNRQVNGS